MRVAGKRTVGDVVILDLMGRADVVGCDDEVEETVTALGAAGYLKVLLNLARVRGWDGSGLGVIVRCYTCLARQGGMLKLLKPEKQLLDLLEETKLTVFEVYEDEDEAVRSFAAPSVPPATP